jgi:hypothetical protein
MNFNDHSQIQGRHAFLSPSNYHWINYTDDKLNARFFTAMASRRGTELHAFAHEAIRLGVKLPKNSKTVNLYVNDAISYRMTCEVGLFYSENCFGHADTMSFRKNKLRISDLKTGEHKASFHQLEVYCALFCLEYFISPFDIDFELRIYQNNSVVLGIPTSEIISEIMDKIILFDKQIQSLKEGSSW